MPVRANAAPAGWIALSSPELANLRGTFIPAQGLLLTLGVEQLAAINGQLVARSELTLAQGGATLSASDAAGSLLLVQNGIGKLWDPALATGSAGMVIQNTLNDQAIASQTIINASVNSRTLIDTINFQSQLSDALARASAAR